MAWTLGSAVDSVGGASEERGRQERKDGNPRRRATPKRMRVWRLRRELFALPGRIARRAHEMKVTLLGLAEATRKLFECYWGALNRC